MSGKKANSKSVVNSATEISQGLGIKGRVSGKELLTGVVYLIPDSKYIVNGFVVFVPADNTPSFMEQTFALKCEKEICIEVNTKVANGLKVGDNIEMVVSVTSNCEDSELDVSVNGADKKFKLKSLKVYG